MRAPTLECSLFSSGAEVVDNPYLDRFFEVRSEEFRRRHGDSMRAMSDEQLNEFLDKQISYGMMRDDLVLKYSFAIPNDAALEAIARHRPIVELGAGTGYWAWMLRQMGVGVFAYDLHPPPSKGNRWFPDVGTFTEVLKGDVEALDRHEECTLLLCWPPPKTDMAERAIARYRGERVIYIGEGFGGCTVSDSFFEALEIGWKTVDEVEIPKWNCIHDCLTIHERK